MDYLCFTADRAWPPKAQQAIGLRLLRHNPSALVSIRLPTTTSSTSRWSGSKATWSHWSPQNRSSSSPGSQCFSFLPTNDHFSSSWSARVSGGKAHQLVVELVGVVAGAQAVADDGILADAGEARGLADAAALGQVVQHGHGLVRGQAGVEQRGALALGEAGLAGAAVQQPAPLAPIVSADGEVAVAALPVVRALGILAAEAAQVLHGVVPGVGASRAGHSAAACSRKTQPGVQYCRDTTKS